MLCSLGDDQMSLKGSVSESPKLNKVTSKRSMSGSPKRLVSETIVERTQVTVEADSEFTREWSSSHSHDDFKRTLEYSCHTCPKWMKRELKDVFIDLKREDYESMLAIVTFQQTQVDLISIGSDADYEKDLCLNLFLQWGNRMVKLIELEGYWIDLIDPTSGQPLLMRPGRSYYPETTGAQSLLKYHTTAGGCCQMICHPLWGTRCYPASLFTTAPREIVIKCLSQLHIQYSEDLEEDMTFFYN